MVLYNGGISKHDVVCGRFSPQRFYTSGNERTTTRLNGVAKYGVKVDTGDTFRVTTELMNESEVAISVYLTIVRKSSTLSGDTS